MVDRLTRDREFQVGGRFKEPCSLFRLVGFLDLLDLLTGWIFLNKQPSSKRELSQIGQPKIPADLEDFVR